MLASRSERLERVAVRLFLSLDTMSIGSVMQRNPRAKRAVAQAPLLHQDGFSQTRRGAGWSSPASGEGGGRKGGRMMGRMP